MAETLCLPGILLDGHCDPGPHRRNGNVALAPVANFKLTHYPQVGRPEIGKGDCVRGVDDDATAPSQRGAARFDDRWDCVICSKKSPSVTQAQDA